MLMARRSKAAHLFQLIDSVKLDDNDDKMTTTIIVKRSTNVLTYEAAKPSRVVPGTSINLNSIYLYLI